MYSFWIYFRISYTIMDFKLSKYDVIFTEFDGID